MKIYSDELKARLIERMLPLQEASVSELSRETGIPKDTLYCWRVQARRLRGQLGHAVLGELRQNRRAIRTVTAAAHSSVRATLQQGMQWYVH